MSSILIDGSSINSAAVLRW